ncbi:MAG: hypothetical protein OEV62_00025 [Actinomycetota bacterium]|nr:hypothetical protein [Actinomycetota bacterium]
MIRLAALFVGLVWAAAYVKIFADVFRGDARVGLVLSAVATGAAATLMLTFALGGFS